MHSRFFCGRNDAAGADTSPRRRLRLFSMNERPRKQALPAVPLVAKVALEPTSRDESESSLSKEQPDRSPRSPKKAPTSPRKPINSAPPLPRRNVPSAPLLERNETPPSLHSSRPGVSFQRNSETAQDPIAAKMSTYDNNNRAGV